MKKVQGHFKKKELLPWDAMMPRDNLVYKISETQNLRHLDSEIREEFREKVELWKSNRSRVNSGQRTLDHRSPSVKSMTRNQS